MIRRIFETFDYKGKIEVFEPQREPERTKNLPYLIVIKINVDFYLHCNYQHPVISGC